MKAQREYIVPIDDESRNIDEMFIGEIRKNSELIRCCECKYRNKYGYCTLYITWHIPKCDMQYCSDGKRREE
jgi:hypothetical protein